MSGQKMRAELAVMWLKCICPQLDFNHIEDLSDGVILTQFLNYICPENFSLSKLKKEPSYENSLSNLVNIWRSIAIYYNDFMNFSLDSQDIDLKVIAKNNHAETLIALTDIVLGVVLQCERKKEFIESMTKINQEYQNLLIPLIQNILQLQSNQTNFLEQQNYTNPNSMKLLQKLDDLEQENQQLKSELSASKQLNFDFEQKQNSIFNNFQLKEQQYQAIIEEKQQVQFQSQKIKSLLNQNTQNYEHDLKIKQQLLQEQVEENKKNKLEFQKIQKQYETEIQILIKKQQKQIKSQDEIQNYKDKQQKLQNLDNQELVLLQSQVLQLQNIIKTQEQEKNSLQEKNQILTDQIYEIKYKYEQQQVQQQTDNQILQQSLKDYSQRQWTPKYNSVGKLFIQTDFEINQSSEYETLQNVLNQYNSSNINPTFKNSFFLKNEVQINSPNNNMQYKQLNNFQNCLENSEIESSQEEKNNLETKISELQQQNLQLNERLNALNLEFEYQKQEQEKKYIQQIQNLEQSLNFQKSIYKFQETSISQDEIEKLKMQISSYKQAMLKQNYQIQQQDLTISELSMKIEVLYTENDLLRTTKNQYQINDQLELNFYSQIRDSLRSVLYSNNN